MLQGLLELIERDAVALWWYNRLRRSGVDLEGADDPYVSDLVRHYGELQRELWVLDVTSDFGVPTFAAISKRVDKAEEDIIYGFGAHLDPAVALNLPGAGSCGDTAWPSPFSVGVASLPVPWLP